MALKIPSAIVGTLRATLVSQGFPPTTIDNEGNLDPIALLSGVYDTVEFRSHAAPPVKLRLDALSGPSGSFVKFLRPTVIFTGKGGRAVLAPEGEALNTVGTLVAALAVGSIFYLGFRVGRLLR